MLGGVLGLVCGVFLALGLQSLFSAIGMDMPTSGLSVRPRTVLVALAVGLLVTLVAALVPARRASRVAPVAAMRVGTAQPRRATVRRGVAGLVLLLVSVALVVWGSARSGGDLTVVGLGAGLLLVGLILLAPVIAPCASPCCPGRCATCSTSGWPGATRPATFAVPPRPRPR